MKAHSHILRQVIRLSSAVILLSAAACAKLEPSDTQDRQEITFQTVTAPKTRAGSPLAFPTSSRFYSYAYYLQSPENWDSYYAHFRSGSDWALYRDNAKLHIDGAEISYQVDRWKINDSQLHLWPLTGALTFFSWTDGSASPALADNPEGTTSISCTPERGITLANYSTAVAANRNKDILIADIAKDQSANSFTYAHNGVPTIFRHAMSKFEFKAGLGETDPANSYVLTRIEFTGIIRQASYQQISNIVDGDEVGSWNSDATDNGTVVMFDGSMPVTSHDGGEMVDNSSSYSILIPQYIGGNDNLSLKKIIIYYTANGTPKTKEASLSTLYGANFAIGTKYTLEISIGNNEVFWAPGVEEWMVEEKDWYISRD